MIFDDFYKKYFLQIRSPNRSTPPAHARTATAGSRDVRCDGDCHALRVGGRSSEEQHKALEMV